MMYFILFVTATYISFLKFDCQASSIQKRSFPYPIVYEMCPTGEFATGGVYRTDLNENTVVKITLFCNKLGEQKKDHEIIGSFYERTNASDSPTTWCEKGPITGYQTVSGGGTGAKMYSVGFSCESGSDYSEEETNRGGFDWDDCPRIDTQGVCGIATDKGLEETEKGLIGVAIKCCDLPVTRP